MKWIVVTAAALAGVAGPAAAEFGKGPAPSGFQKPKPATGAFPASPYASRPTPSDYGASSSKSKTYGAPSAAEPYKPYQPYKSQPGASVFGPDGKKRR